MERVLIAGGSGYIGRHLTQQLIQNGYEVSWLTRKPSLKNPIKQYTWNYKVGAIEHGAIANADVLINLAGAPINGRRWNRRYKQEIQDSRIQATQFLFETLKTTPNTIRTYVHASAIGFYGYEDSVNPHTENDAAGIDFLATTCRLWEEKAVQFEKLNIRTCIIRTGIVFNSGSEAFNKIISPFRFHVGAIIGTGKQYFPWIHIYDLCNAYSKMLFDRNTHGAYNAVAPDQITNGDLTKEIAKYYPKKILIFNIPAPIVRLLLGGIAKSMLSGSKISSGKIIAAGFKFHYGSIKDLFQKPEIS